MITTNKLLRPNLRRTLVAALFLLAQPILAELIPADRLANWTPGTYTGVAGGIPTNWTVYTNMTSLDGTGKTDCSAALQAAINSAPSASVVKVPMGKFLLNQAITLQSTVILRGDGMDRTTFLSSGGFRIEADNSFYTIAAEQRVLGGLTKGSTNFLVADTSSFAVGKMCLIAQFSSTNPNDNPLVVAIGGTNAQSGYVHRVLVAVNAKTANSVTFWPPLWADMSARNARVKASPFQKGFLGVEDATIQLANTQVGIAYTGVFHSWLKRVRVKGARNYSVSFADSLNLEVRDCYLDDQEHCPACSNGAGLLLNLTCASLFENNIIVNSYPGIEINSGSCGNVFGYNFILNTNGAIEIDSNHGPHNSHNLFEGNLAGRFLSDAYFGSESEGTVFRNWFHGQTLGQTTIGWAFSLKRFTRNYSLVGNIFGSDAPFTMAYDGTSFGQPNMGNSDSSGFAPPWANWLIPQLPGQGYQEYDRGVTNTLFRKANYNYFNRTVPVGESLGDQPLPRSLYLVARPTWFGTLSWPPFDPGNVPNQPPSYTSIPAGYRFVNGRPPPMNSLSVPLHPRFTNTP